MAIKLQVSEKDFEKNSISAELKEKFVKEVKKRASASGSYLDAIETVMFIMEIEPEQVPRLLTTEIKNRLIFEASKRKLLKKEYRIHVDKELPV